MSRSRPLTKDLLTPYLPPAAVDPVFGWFSKYRTNLIITRTRSSKLGDYRPVRSHRVASISVNHNLNPYSFLITLVHEMAHHEVFEEHNREGFLIPFKRSRRPKPHGVKWQEYYRRLMIPFLNKDVFPASVLAVLEIYFQSPNASTSTDQQLVRELKKYDKPDDSVFVESIPPGGEFQLPDGRRFLMKEKVRTRYRCINLRNNRIYLFNSLAQVYPV